jgi:hypothetical protein
VTLAPTTEPTATPTSKPTQAPVAPPTQSPTNALIYTTENKFDADLSATIRQSQCPNEPPVIEFVQGATFVYRYEVTRLEGESEGNLDETAGTFEIGSMGDSVNKALDTGLVDLSESWTEDLHDELAREFLICDGYDFDTVWILQSKPHFVDETTPCGASDSDNDETTSNAETPDDEDSNDFSACVSVVAEARIIAYRSPLGKKITKQLWAETTYDVGETAERFALDAIAFLDVRLNSGDGGLGFAPTFGVGFVGGYILQEDAGETGGDGGSDSNGSSTGEGTGDDSDSDTSGNLWTDTGTAVGIAGSINTNKNGNLSVLTPAMIATIAVVGSCLLLLLFLGAIGRNRRKNRQHQEDEEFLQDVATPRSDGHQYSSTPVDHLDLSDSSDNGSEGPLPNREPDLERSIYASGSASSPTNSHRGRRFQKPKAPLSPHHFHFSGFSAVVTSPTSRERSKMGPLGLSDEFRDHHRRSSSDDYDDSAPGTHRGGVVSNSSSMSSLPPPPHQNSSPRLYQLRDTVKL